MNSSSVMRLNRFSTCAWEKQSDALALKRPVYVQTAVGGHFGKEDFAWEKTDKAQELKNAIMP